MGGSSSGSGPSVGIETPATEGMAGNVANALYNSNYQGVKTQAEQAATQARDASPTGLIEADAAAKKRNYARGVASTILNGGMGLSSSPQTASRSLLGT